MFYLNTLNNQQLHIESTLYMHTSLIDQKNIYTVKTLNHFYFSYRIRKLYFTTVKLYLIFILL